MTCVAGDGSPACRAVDGPFLGLSDLKSYDNCTQSGVVQSVQSSTRC
jgi:hypothetical protein